MWVDIWHTSGSSLWRRGLRFSASMKMPISLVTRFSLNNTRLDHRRFRLMRSEWGQQANFGFPFFPFFGWSWQIQSSSSYIQNCQEGKVCTDPTLEWLIFHSTKPCSGCLSWSDPPIHSDQVTRSTGDSKILSKRDEGLNELSRRRRTMYRKI